MKILFAILVMLVSLCGCDPTYDYGRLAYQTQTDSILPLYVYVNGTMIDTITDVDSSDCDKATHSYDLILGSTYKIKIARGNFIDETEVKLGGCELIIVN